ncbi:TPA: glycosyltransferase family 4 protein [Escherichia coli]|nr:WbsU [Escherichia coli]HCT7260895.1 glycosyltransferase family 4 protein [Escherichia coli]
MHTVLNTFTAKKFVEPLLDNVNEQHNKEKIIHKILIDPVNGDERFLKELHVHYEIKKFDIDYLFIKHIIELYFYFRKERPDIVIAHMSRGAILPLISAFIARVPKRIYFNHGVPYIGYKNLPRMCFKLLEKLNCFFSNQVLTVSQGMIEPLTAITKKPVSILGPGSACGIDHNEFQRKSKYDIENIKQQYAASDTFIFTFVGRPVARKGFDITLKAFTKAFSGADNVILLLAGATSEDIFRVLGSKPNNIKPLGFVMDLDNVYLATDVVVVPSEHEGFCYALLEGAARECALICSDIPGPDAIVINKRNGILITPKNIDSLMVSMSELFNDREMTKKYGEQAYMIASEFERKKIMLYYSYYIRSLFIEQR